MSKYQFIEDKVSQLKTDKVFRVLPVLSSGSSNIVELNGKKVINLSGNNYLGLANHPRLKKAAMDAIEQYGVGAGSVRTIVGNFDLLEELEKQLAMFKNEEAVTCFQSGLNCNIGCIQAIVDKGDLIISDELNHASIIDGIRLSKADKAVYKHNDMKELESILKEKRNAYKTVLIITDGVFSMDGDLANLPKIVELAKRYDALTYVDDAHGSGVLGKSGRGTVDHFGLHGEIDFIIGTLSKAVGVIGGYVASKQIVKDWLLHRARPLLFSTALPPSAIAATIEAIKMLNESEEYTNMLWNHARYFKKRMQEIGFDCGKSETPITPIMIGEEAKTLEFSRMLLEKGVFVSAIVFPTVAKGKGRLRVMPSASHTMQDLEQAIEAFMRVGKKLEVI